MDRALLPQKRLWVDTQSFLSLRTVRDQEVMALAVPEVWGRRVLAVLGVCLRS